MKRIISFVFAMILVLSCVSCAGNGDDAVTTASVTTGAPVAETPAPEDSFSLSKRDDGTYCVVSFATDSEEPHEVVIPADYEGAAVTAIAPDAFSGSTAISKIVIPDSVTYIGDGAFADCTELLELELSKNIAEIGKGAFKNCAKLKSADVSFSVKLGAGAFDGCESLKRKIYAPEEDETMYILMVGNSFCYYYPDELFGIAKEAGINMVICNVYYSGCTIQSHYDWWQNNRSNYEFYIYDQYGRKGISNCGLETCLSAYDWDVISIQDGPTPYRQGGISGAVAAREPGLTELLKLFKERFPDADLYWHHFWSSQVGYEYKGYGIPNKSAQDKEYRDYCTLTKSVVTKHGLDVIPSGEAWEKARANELIGDTLCMADCHHEGEEGGGQYLNACVWFEMLTGRSVIGNPYRPSYNLLESKIPVLQQAAHDAVLEGKFDKN